MRKILLVSALLLLVVINVLVYWSYHLYYKSETVENSEKQIVLLERSKQINPYNDMVFYALGMAYFHKGIEDLTNTDQRDINLQKSTDNFIRSIQLNPGYYKSHFSFAQMLLYREYFTSLDIDFYEEYKRAAHLTTYDDDRYFEIGRIMFLRWSELTDEEKDFTLDILKNVISSQGREKMQTILQLWAMNEPDYGIIDRIFPHEPRAYRQYAQFLGERSLSLEVRQNKLARAEFWEFAEAKRAFSMGQREYRFFRLKKADDRFRSSLKTLDRIKFYQALTREELIDSDEYLEVKKSVALGLIKSTVQRRRNLSDTDRFLRMYLDLEDEILPLGELESYLNVRKMLKTRINPGDPISPLFIKLWLDFKQNRYRDVTREVGAVNDLAYALPQSSRDDYVKILRMVGDSFQKLDFLYDSEEWYLKALEYSPDNLMLLYKLRENYERLNDEGKIRDIDRRINRLLSTQESAYRNSPIDKGRKWVRRITSSGDRMTLTLEFKKEEGTPPLIAVFFNGLVLYENYVEGNGKLTLDVASYAGENVLEILAVNKAVVLNKLTYSLSHP